jgi:hypothetical protein
MDTLGPRAGCGLCFVDVQSLPVTTVLRRIVRYDTSSHYVSKSSWSSWSSSLKMCEFLILMLEQPSFSSAPSDWKIKLCLVSVYQKLSAFLNN